MPSPANDPSDNENNHPDNYDTLASALRTKYQTDHSKTYYLSSAPQCPFPDASNPLSMLLICDFVFVQFYNNGPCEIGSTNFHDSIHQWSAALDASTLSPKPRLYVGAPAWSAAGPTAYTHIGSPMGMRGIAADVKGLGVANLGGVMFWDGPEAMLNLEAGKDILGWTKEGLVS
jgi:chitinase